MTHEIEMLLGAAAKIKQICQSHAICTECPLWLEIPSQYRGKCRISALSGDGTIPGEWTLEVEDE